MAMMLGEAVATIKLDVADLMANAAAAEARISQLETAMMRGGSGAAAGFDQATGSLLALGAAGSSIAAGLGMGLMAGVQNAAALEQSITNVSASLGGLDDDAFAQLTADMQDLGTNSQFSAVEVSAVAEELAKMGTATPAIRGTTEAVINLAQATGADLQTSVSGIGQAMAIWDESLVDASIALEDASRAADMLTVAANQSAADVGDIIAGMRNLGPVAAQMGVGFDEAAAAIALFTNYGLKGADAGISLARGLQNLAAPSGEVATKLEALGLSMEGLGIQAFDLQGNFVGFPELFRQLNAGLADLDQQTRLAALSAIFGAEAMDVMALAIQSGAAPLEDLIALMEQEGIAAEQAAARTDTLAGAWQRAQEGFGTMLGSLMQGAIPVLTEAADLAAAAADAINGLPDPIQNAIGVTLALTAALIGLNAALNLAAAGAGRLGLVGGLTSGAGFLGGLRNVGSFTASLLGLTRVFSPLGLAISGVALVGGSLVSSFLEQKAAADDYRASVTSLEQALEMLRRQGDTELADAGKNLGSMIDGLQTRMDELVQSMYPSSDEFFGRKFEEEWGRAFDPSNYGDLQLMEAVRQAYADEWQAMVDAVDEAVGEYEVSVEDMTALNSLLVEALGDPNIDAQRWIEWSTGLLESADSAEELHAAIELILSTPLSDFSRNIDGVNDALGETEEQARASAEAVNDLFTIDAIAMDDLRIEGKDQIAREIEDISGMFDESFAPDYWMTAMDVEGMGAPFTNLARTAMQASEISQDSLDRLGAAWDRIREKMMTGDFDNAAIMQALEAILNNPNLTADQQVAEIEKLSQSLHLYVDELAAAKDAMQEWLAEGDNFLDFWLEYQQQRFSGGPAALDEGALPDVSGITGQVGVAEVTLTGIESFAEAAEVADRLRENLASGAAIPFTNVVQLARDLDNAAAALDSVLATFGRIDDLGGRSDQAGSIAEELVGTPGEWSTLDDLLAAGRISLAEYNRTLEAGYAIQESNARSQEHLNKIRADQLPLLAEEQAAYEAQLAALAALPPLEQRRALAMQDSAVQAQLASLYSTAYAASLGEIPPEVATSMIVSAAEADPVLKDLLLQFGLIEEGADGTITVNFPDGQTVQSTITELTKSIDALIETLGGVPPVHLEVEDEASPVIDSLLDKLDDLATRKKPPIKLTADEQPEGPLLLPPGPPTGHTGDGTPVTMLPNTGQTGQAADLTLPDYAGQIAAAQAAMAAAAATAGQAAGAALVQGLLNALPVWGTALTAYGTQLTTQGATWLASGTAAGQQAGAGIVQGALNALPVWVAALTGYTTQLTTAGTTWATAGTTAGQTAGVGAAQGALNALPTFAAAMAGFTAVIDGEAGAMGAAGLNAGAAGGFGVANGMDMASGQIAGVAASWPAYIDGIAGAMGAAGYNAGAAAGFGVANGLTAALGAVQAAAAAIIDAATAAMNAAGEISSPSRRTRRETGLPLGQGVALGLLDALPLVRAGAGTLVDAAALPVGVGGRSPLLASPRPVAPAGGTTIYGGRVAINAYVTTQGRMDEAEKQQFVVELADAIRDGVDLVYTSQGGDL